MRARLFEVKADGWAMANAPQLRGEDQERAILRRQGAAGRAGGAGATANKITAEIKELAHKHGPDAIAELARLAKKVTGDTQLRIRRGHAADPGHHGVWRRPTVERALPGERWQYLRRGDCEACREWCNRPEATLWPMAGGIRITGYRLDKAGKLVKCSAHKDVSARLRERHSKKVRLIRAARLYGCNRSSKNPCIHF